MNNETNNVSERSTMKIRKMINNNIILSVNDSGMEVILLGKALGFQKKVGDEINEASIEKIYYLQDKHTEQELLEMLSDIDFTNIQVVNKVVDYAEIALGKKLSSAVYISLLDHINFAIERTKSNIIFENTLHNEIKRFYPLEYSIGEKSLEIVKNELNVSLPRDEASFVAMHILNAQLNNDYMENTDIITRILTETLTIAHEKMHIDFDCDSISYDRFITHLKFFSVRLLNGESLGSVNQSVFNVIVEQYKVAFEGALAIKAYIEESFEKQVEDSELMYLTIHLNTFIQKNEKDKEIAYGTL